MDLDTCERFRCDFLQTRVSPSPDQKLLGHQAVLIGHFVYVWGGFTSARDANRIWILNIRSYKWRVKHVKNVSNTGAFVDMMFVKDDLIYALSRIGLVADGMLVKIDPLQPVEILPVQTSNQPRLTRGCCGAFLEERQEFVVVKRDASVHSLNCDSFRWDKAKATGDVPLRLVQNTCCSFRNTLYITNSYGTDTRTTSYGPDPRTITLHILTAELAWFRWSTPRVGGFKPPSRDGMTLTCSGPHRIFVFGGTGHSSEVNVYSVRDGKWRNLSETASSDLELECFGERLGGTSYHAAVQTKEFLLVLGGDGTDYWLSSPLRLSALRNR